MATAGRSAALKLDWNKITSGLHLKGQTAASLQAFKKRNDDARRKINQLNAQPQSIDFQTYRDTLKNTAVVDEIEGQLKQFKPKTYDVSRQLKALEAFEVQAVKSAEETKEMVDAEVTSLSKALDDIAKVRPWEQIDIDDVFQALPETEEHMEEKIRRGIWGPPPGYYEKFGDPAIM